MDLREQRSTKDDDGCGASLILSPSSSLTYVRIAKLGTKPDCGNNPTGVYLHEVRMTFEKYFAAVIAFVSLGLAVVSKEPVAHVAFGVIGALGVLLMGYIMYLDRLEKAVGDEIEKRLNLLEQQVQSLIAGRVFRGQ